MQSIIDTWNLKNKTVLLRIDGNVPIANGNIINDQRLNAMLPTLQLLLNKGAQVILITHLGRPKAQEKELSTQWLIPWLQTHGFEVAFARDLQEAQHKKASGHQLILLENVRFFPGEQAQDPTFTKAVAALGDYFVQDAFGTLHRKDSSIAHVPAFFDQAHRSIGLLIEHELAALDQLLTNPPKPFFLIIGGGKVSDKIPLIKKLLPHLTDLFLGPAIVFSFLKAQGHPVGASLVDENALDTCKQIIEQAQQLGVAIHYPVDYIVAQQTFNGPLRTICTTKLEPNDCGVSIGPKTAALWATACHKAQAILVNGLMGSVKRPETIVNMQTVFQAIEQSHATSIIAGGDSIAAAKPCLPIAHNVYLSTGGGATLAYMSGKPLPGLEAFKK